MNRTSLVIRNADTTPDIRDLFFARQQRRADLRQNIGMAVFAAIMITLAIIVPLPF